MQDGMLISALALGFVLGLKHALEPDHMVAVSTIVSEHGSVGKSSLVGAFWGLGHTASLVAAGIVIVLLKLKISETTRLWMEFVVALMLVLLGARALARVLRGWRLHAHRHEHDGRPHTHLHLHRQGDEHAHDGHRHLVRLGARPFLIGMVHGMAGSAALTLLVLATIPSAVAGLIYIAVFGLGSIGGMLIMSTLMSLPFVLSRKKFGAINEGLQLVAGLASFAFGLFLIWQYGFQEHLIY